MILIYIINFTIFLMSYGEYMTLLVVAAPKQIMDNIRCVLLYLFTFSKYTTHKELHSFGRKRKGEQELEVCLVLSKKPTLSLLILQGPILAHIS